MNDTTTDRDADAIRALIDDWCEAARARDVDRIFTLYTDDLVAFDAIGPLSFDSLDDYRQHWVRCMEMCPGEMIFEVRDLEIAIEGDSGYAHYIARCGARQEDGSEQTGHMRATVVLRRTPAGWKIRHEHYSMPFDPANCSPDA